MKCSRCDRILGEDDTYFCCEEVIPVKCMTRTRICCSPSCLVEWAWSVKEQQMKLSKSSKEESHGTTSEKDA